MNFLYAFNRLLNEYLKNEVGSDIEVKTYNELAEVFGVHLLNPPHDYEGEREDWTQYEAPERLKRAIEKSEKRFDAVLCDEAQDVQPFWWEAIESVLVPEDSHFLIAKENKDLQYKLDAAQEKITQLAKQNTHLYSTIEEKLDIDWHMTETAPLRSLQFQLDKLTSSLQKSFKHSTPYSHL